MHMRQPLLGNTEERFELFPEQQHTKETTGTAADLAEF